MTSCVSPWVGPASAPRSGGSEQNGITASDARRGAGTGSTDPVGAAEVAGRAAAAAPLRPSWMARQAARTGSKSKPSDAKSRAAAARWSRQSPKDPCAAIASRSAACARASKGAISTHAARCDRASSWVSARPSARRSSTAAWQAWSRRRCATSQPSKSGLRSISDPSSSSPTKSRERARSRSVPIVPIPAATAAEISEGVHGAVVEPQGHGVARRLHPGVVGIVQEAPELAQAPAQLAARIVGHVPQELAQARARHRAWSEREVAHESAQLARRRQLERGAVAVDRQRAEEAQAQAQAVRRTLGHTGDPFHARSHARSHAGSIPPSLSRDATDGAPEEIPVSVRRNCQETSP